MTNTLIHVFGAAQSLLWLTQPASLDRRRDLSRDVFLATPANPRYTEGSVVELLDGSLLFATTEFFSSGSDFAKAHIVAKRSADGGQSWSKSRVVQENTGGMNVMSATLRRINASQLGDTIALFYLEKDSYSDLHCFVRFSTDEGASFGDPVQVTQGSGYHVVNNDRVTQLRDGRLIVPVAYTSDVREENHFISICYYSDDSGRTWKRGADSVDMPKRGAMEPEVIELNDGRLMIILRNQLGAIAASLFERSR